MYATVMTSPQLRSALTELGVEPTDDGADPLVLEVAAPGDAWSDVMAELQRTFHHAQVAARAGAAVVVIVHNDDLLGRRGAGNAMVATGVLSAIRTLALEGRKRGVSANVVVIEDDTDPELTARWIATILEGGPTGEMIRLGAGHLGKALP